MWFYAWRKHVESFHCIVIAIGIILCYLHWLKLLKTSFLLYLVVTFICIMLKMTYIGDVSYVAHLISEMLKITEYEVECYCWTRMSQVWITINGWSADIHSHVWGMKRNKRFFSPCQSIVND